MQNTERVRPLHGDLTVIRARIGQCDVLIFLARRYPFPVLFGGAGIHDQEQLVPIEPVHQKVVDNAAFLIRKGRVMCLPIDELGHVVGRDAIDESDRVLAFDARRLGDVAVSIGVGAGERKVRPILGALRSRAVRTLVTDVETAEAVVALDAA